MEDSGWIKLHRALLEGPIIQHAGMLQVWVYCLLRANWEAKRVMVDGSLAPIEVHRGEFVTGRNSLHAALYPKKEKDAPVAMTVWRWLEALERMECLKLRTVCNRCTVVTVCNYSTYQSKEPAQCSADVPPVFTDKNYNNQRIEESNNHTGGSVEGNPRITSIEIEGDILEFNQDPMRWVAEFVRQWNALKGVRRHDSSALSLVNHRNLLERLREADWFWKRAFQMFPLYLPGKTWTITLGKFLEAETVGKILEGRYERDADSKLPDEPDNFTFTEEELED